MAFVRPVYYVAGGHLRQMNDTQISNVQANLIHQYRGSISNILTVVASGGNLGSLTDTRLQHNSTLPLPIISTGYARLTQSITAIANPGMTDLPMYYTAAGHLRVMSIQDFIDTFMPSIINFNPYTVSTVNAISGYTLISTTPIFSDTRAVADTATTVTTINNYYLHRVNPGTPPALVPMAYIHGTNGFAFKATQEAHLLNVAKYILYAQTNYRLRYWYSISGGGTDLGTVLTDTRLNSYIKRTTGTAPYTVTTYRPYGSAVAINYYALRAYQV